MSVLVRAKKFGSYEKNTLKRWLGKPHKLYTYILGDMLRGYSLFNPLAIQIETTINCNLRCVHCERTYWDQQHFTDLSFEQFKKIIDPIKGLRFVSLTGIGEPLLNPHLLEMAHYAKSKGIVVGFTTNGTLLKAKGREIIESGVDMLAISMESAKPEVFEKIRVGARFASIVENISYLIKLKREMHRDKPDVELRTVAMENTVDEIPPLVELAAQLGVRYVMVAPLIYEYRDELVSASREHAERVLGKSRGLADKLGVQLQWELFDDNHFKPGSCIVPYHTPYVFKDGQVAPCCLMTQRGERSKIIQEQTFGNVIETPYPQIMNSKSFRGFRRALLSRRFQSVPEVCKSCWMLKRD